MLACDTHAEFRAENREPAENIDAAYDEVRHHVILPEKPHRDAIECLSTTESNPLRDFEVSSPERESVLVERQVGRGGRAGRSRREGDRLAGGRGDGAIPVRHTRSRHDGGRGDGDRVGAGGKRRIRRDGELHQHARGLLILGVDVVAVGDREGRSGLQRLGVVRRVDRPRKRRAAGPRSLHRRRGAVRDRAGVERMHVLVHHEVKPERIPEQPVAVLVGDNVLRVEQPGEGRYAERVGRGVEAHGTSTVARGGIAIEDHPSVQVHLRSGGHEQSGPAGSAGGGAGGTDGEVDRSRSGAGNAVRIQAGDGRLVALQVDLGSEFRNSRLDIPVAELVDGERELLGRKRHRNNPLPVEGEGRRPFGLPLRGDGRSLGDGIPVRFTHIDRITDLRTSTCKLVGVLPVDTLDKAQRVVKHPRGLLGDLRIGKKRVGCHFIRYPFEVLSTKFHFVTPSNPL